jgi:peptide/nickel transport system substrate-binding protein
MKRSLVVTVVLMFVFTVLFAACSPPEQAEPLVVLIDNDEGPITPANFNTFIGYWMVGWVYDSLYVRGLDLEPVPALATEAMPSADGLTWEIQLREGVEWHDGEAFTVDDVIFTYEFLVEAGRAPNLEVIEEMEARGEHGLTIRLAEPAPFFLSEGLAGYYIMPEHIWRDQEPVSDELSQFQGEVGTGAYRLMEVTPGESYTFEANEGYFMGEPEVPLLVAKIVTDRTQQFNQLRSGAAAAVLSSIPPAIVAEVADDEAIAVAEGSDFFNYVFYANASQPPFDQQDVRRALALAIDRETLVDTVMLGRGTVLPASYYHPDLPWAAGIPLPHDPDAARRLLEGAGLTDGDGDGIREWEGEDIDFAVLCDVNNPAEVRSVELITEWLGDVGIGAHPDCMDIDTAVSFIWPGFVAVPDPEYDLAIWGWSSGPQFQRGFLRFLISDPEGLGWANLTGATHEELQGMFTELVSTPDAARREELTRAIQERFAEVLPMIPLMSPGGNFAYVPAEYDGWDYMEGTGIMTVWSFLPDGGGQ